VVSGIFSIFAIEKRKTNFLNKNTNSNETIKQTFCAEERDA
jgi:hypothetical protein